MSSFFRLGFLADIASLLGLVVSLIGFWLTVVSARRAARSAEQARVAADDAVSRIRMQVLASEIDEVLRHVHVVERACRQLDWDEAIGSCDEAKVKLFDLVGSGRLDRRDVGLEEHLKFLSTLLDILTVRPNSKSAGTLIPKQYREGLSVLSTELVRIKAREVREKGAGYNHG